ncbi:putative F-box protein [Citrus sinensis]|uniref:F-box protein n=1 Tax=Citrus sinensis TaxID=2711 RepID=A0ACB8J8J3_CITSI|nr:putative F-box protein [Citrus sinensis]
MGLTSGSRVPRTGISCKSLVAGEQEQEYSARPRIRHPRGRSSVRSIKPFLLRVEARRPGQRELARRALQSENQGTKVMQPSTITETEHSLSRDQSFLDSSAVSVAVAVAVGLSRLIDRMNRESGDDIVIMEEVLSSMDRISNLPEPILHCILSFLSFKQVVQTTVLSQAWERAWRTFPILEFDKTFFNQVPSVSCNNKIEAQLGDEKLSRALNYVEGTLRTRRREMIRLDKFTLDLYELRVKEPGPFVDRCIFSALESDVKELKLALPFHTSARVVDTRPGMPSVDAHNKRCYNLPQEVLCSKSIQVLALSCCKLQSLRSVKLSSLKKLCLTSVYAADLVLESLVDGCPLIEHLSLVNCLGFNTLDLSGLTKLNEFKVRNCLEVLWLSIQTLNVKTVSIQLSLPCEINVASCKNIKFLTLRLLSLKDEWLCSQIPNFSFLENLNLVGCDKLKSIKISSLSLKMLKIFECAGLIEVKIEAPNLSIFRYQGDVVSFSIGAMTLLETHLSFNKNNSDIDWYSEYIGLLAMFHNVSKAVNLESYKGENADIPEDLRQIRSSPFYGYNNLDFVINGTRVRVAIKNTIDGLLWISPHLRTVTIKSFYSNWFSFKFEFSYKKQAVYEGGVAQCCKSRPISCWRQCIEQVVVEYTSNGVNNVKRSIFNGEDIWEKIDWLADLDTSLAWSVEL